MSHLTTPAPLRLSAGLSLPVIFVSFGFSHRSLTVFGVRADLSTCWVNATEMKLQVTAAEVHRPHGHLEAGDPRADTNFHVQMALSEFSFFQ